MEQDRPYKDWPGKITISDPVTLINEIAKRYETLERVIMEYIDNSLDDADDMATENNGTYPYPIKIQVTIDRDDKRVIIRDNCRGMDFNTLSRIVHKIGESKKRACPWLNGRFGFGVHAFRGFCAEVIFRTKHNSDNHYIIKIRKDNMYVQPPYVDEGEFFSTSGTGTVVTLQKFDEDFFEGLTVEAIKEEVETHFETMLRKDKLEILVNYKGEKPLTCRAFDYNNLPGKTFDKKENIIYNNKNYPVEIFLKVVDIPTARRPRFFAKGRRILFIKDDKSFINKSKYRTSVWDHANLTGYIEVGDIVEPVITRDGFNRGKNRGLLYDAILQYEDEIKDALDEINKRYEDHSLNRLEDVLSKALRKLAKEDALRLTSELSSSNEGDTTLAEGGGSDITDGKGGPSGQNKNVDSNGLGGSAEGNGFGPEGNGSGKFQGEGSDGPLPKQGTSDFTGVAKRKSGFGIKFIKVPADNEGKFPRSQFNSGTILINMEHPDFIERIERNRKGELQLTDRLISYIAAVVSIHYKDQYYEKYHNQPDVRTDLFDEQVDFIFRLENTLLPFLKEIKDLILTKEEEQYE
jgi:hypothetical protein